MRPWRRGRGCNSAASSGPAEQTPGTAVPARLRDCLSTPKQNDYQSIHTTIVGPRHQRAELQIRTERMHSVAEYGVAAHALYKDANGGSVPLGVVPSQESNAYRWLRPPLGV